MKAWPVLILLLACEKAESKIAEAPAPMVSRRETPRATDPARIDGTWDYRTESNCGEGGVGSVSFRWDPERAVYREDGHVRWPATDLTIRWWGDAKFDAAARTLSATIDNSLGDKVTGEWRLEGEGPERLVIEWHQTNGCHGLGTATRRR